MQLSLVKSGNFLCFSASGNGVIIDLFIYQNNIAHKPKQIDFSPWGTLCSNRAKLMKLANITASSLANWPNFHDMLLQLYLQAFVKYSWLRSFFCHQQTSPHLPVFVVPSFLSSGLQVSLTRCLFKQRLTLLNQPPPMTCWLTRDLED